MSFQKYRKIAGKFMLICLLVAGNASVSADEIACSNSAQQFWKKFRSAVLQNNVDEVANLTFFPFVLSIGILDADRKNKPTTRTGFLSLYPHLLIKDPGLSLQPSTMRDLITSSKKLAQIYCFSGGGQFRVGDWVFKQKTAEWRFVRVYIEDD